MLTAEEIREELHRLADGDAAARYAVAFWGKGAVEMWALPKLTAPARIICDARSGACNPDELVAMMDAGHLVMTREGLHSKVYLTSKGVLIGSANASANGLGREGEEAGTTEAAVSSSATLMSDAARFFEREAALSEMVTNKMMPTIREAWRRRRAARPLPSQQRTLLDAIAEEPETFEVRGLRVVAYREVAGAKAARRKFNSIASAFYSPRELSAYGRDGTGPYYEDEQRWEVHPGDTFIDYTFDEGPGLRARFNGLWRVKAEDAFHHLGGGRRIILLDKTRSYEGLVFDSRQAALLGRIVVSRVKATGGKTDENNNLVDSPLNDFAAELAAYAAEHSSGRHPLSRDEWVLALEVLSRNGDPKATSPEIVELSSVLTRLAQADGRTLPKSARTPDGLRRRIGVLRNLANTGNDPGHGYPRPNLLRRSGTNSARTTPIRAEALRAEAKKLRSKAEK